MRFGTSATKLAEQCLPYNCNSNEFQLARQALQWLLPLLINGVFMANQPKVDNSQVSLPPELDCDDLDLTAITGDQLSVLERGILPPDLEEFLELNAKSVDLNYEAAVIEFLANASVAVGGNKSIRIRSDWSEKAILWLASIGNSGSGKTPLNHKCVGDLLEDYQKRLHDQYELQKAQWQAEDLKSPKPTRQYMKTNSLTIEQLCAIHEENPAGIGLISDEILAVLNGLNQYKGKGNDRQKVLTLWNGLSFDNPTAKSDRYIPSVFVPICGGIQEGLLKNIINDENTTDGLAARFLFSHLVVSPKPASGEEIQAIDQQLLSAKGRQVMESSFKRLIETRGQPHQVQMEPSAKKCLAEFEYHIKCAARRGDERIYAACMKLNTYLYRIVLLIHYILEDRPDQVELAEKTALYAVKVMRFFEANMLRAYGTVGLSFEEFSARRILSKLRELGGRAKPNDIKQPIKRTVPFKQAPVLINKLIERGLIKEKKEGKETFLELVNV